MVTRYLLLVGGEAEDILNVASHVQLLQHLVALVQNEMLDVLQVERAVSGQRQNPARSPDDDVRVLLGDYKQS